MRTSAGVVDFGPGVIVGESATRTLQLTNEGALDVEWAVEPEDARQERLYAGGGGADGADGWLLDGAEVRGRCEVRGSFECPSLVVARPPARGPQAGDMHRRDCYSAGLRRG